jgi:hypothetical protein
VNGPERLPIAVAVETLSIDDSVVMRSAAPIRIATGVSKTVQLTANWATQVGSRYVQYWEQPVRSYVPEVVKTYHLKFAMHYHPYVCDFIKALNSKGIPGLLSVDTQLPKSAELEGDDNTVFNRDYHPTKNVDHPYPHVNVDFSTEGEGAYSLYNWEWRFHMIMLIATSLSQNQRFEEARHWFHYIFDPTASANEAAPQRYWPFVPFKKTEPERIDDLLEALSYTGNDPQKLEQKPRCRNKYKHTCITRSNRTRSRAYG